MSIDTTKLRVPALLAAFVAASLTLTGCTGGNEDQPSTKSDKTDKSEKKDKKTDEPTEEMTTDVAEPTEDDFQNPETSSVFDIKVGDCLANQDDLGNGSQVTDVPTVPCSQPHAYEVFYEYTVQDAATYPGDSVVSKDAEAQCSGQAFTEFIGHDWNNTALGVTWLYPTEGSWKNGDRLVSCMVYEEGADTGNPTTGSLKGSMK